YSSAKPRPVYESDDVQAYWDVPVFADHEVRKDVRREERKVCPPALGIKTAVPNNRRESKEVLKRMQKAVWSGTLNIARTFKVVT
ncbi:unnamed protein product, partial [Porites evermanni]